MCSTNKSCMFANILENFFSQDYIEKELIIVINYDCFNLPYSLPPNVHIYNLGSKYSLGKCLNYGIEHSSYPIIAKFDDDDYYGPKYLSDTVSLLSLKNVGIVGKACTFIYFKEKQLIGIKNISKENKYVDRVTGSTLMFKRELAEKIPFHDISLGEDIKFCNDCLNLGYKIFSTNRHHYVYIRNKKDKHTWKMDNDYILKRCINVYKITNPKDYSKYDNHVLRKFKNTGGNLMKKPYQQYVEEYLKKRIKLHESYINSGVSVVVCTNKDHTFDDILNNFIRQDHNKKELIIVINKDNINLNEWIDKSKDYRDIKIFKLNEDISLGNCLNYAVDQAKHPIIAKFDDDDYYGPKYLSDTIKSFNITGADVIVKAANFVYFLEDKILAIRTPGEENKFVNFGNGSTLVIKKEVFNSVRFRDMSIAEDVYFCQDCIKNHMKIYSTNKYHHIYFRHPNKKQHTWKISDDDFIKEHCSVVGKVEDYISYANNIREDV
nr:glycosyltransferase family 2 protein [Tissierella creatinophila]